MATGLINFDRQTLRRNITQTIYHLNGECIGTAGRWLPADNDS